MFVDRMTPSEQMLAQVEGAKNLRILCREFQKKASAVHLRELVGGAFSLYAAALIRRAGGIHTFVAEDRDAAAYLMNDFYTLLDERRVLFFPSSYKRSIVYGAEDAQGVVQRTAVLNALEMTPPELSADIFKTGIYLAGGGSLLRGLDKRIAAKTKLPVHLAEDPLRAVARGTGIALKNFDKFTFLIK